MMEMSGNSPGRGLGHCQERQITSNDWITGWTAKFSPIRGPNDNVLKVNSYLPRILYPAKLFLKNEKETGRVYAFT